MTQTEVKADKTMAELKRTLRERGYKSVVVCPDELDTRLSDREWDRLLNGVERSEIPEKERQEDCHLVFKCRCQPRKRRTWQTR